VVGTDHPRVLRRHEGLIYRLQTAQKAGALGTVGKVLLGDLHILDETMQPCPVGTPGTVWFKTAAPFEYFNDPNKNEGKSARRTAA